MIMHSTPSMTPMPVTTDAPTGKLRAPRGERGQLEERRVLVEDQLDPLAGEQLAALAMALHVRRAAAAVGERELLVERASWASSAARLAWYASERLVDAVGQDRASAVSPSCSVTHDGLRFSRNDAMPSTPSAPRNIDSDSARISSYAASRSSVGDAAEHLLRRSDRGRRAEQDPGDQRRRRSRRRRRRCRRRG